MISWTSSDENVVDISGIVTRPEFSYALGNAPVTLTATITSGDVSINKDIYILKLYR